MKGTVAAHSVSHNYVATNWNWRAETVSLCATSCDTQARPLTSEGSRPICTRVETIFRHQAKLRCANRRKRRTCCIKGSEDFNTTTVYACNVVNVKQTENMASVMRGIFWRKDSKLRGRWRKQNEEELCNMQRILCITRTVEHNYISPSSTVGIQLHVSVLYVGHLQVVN